MQEVTQTEPYVFQPFPSVRYNRTSEPVTVNSQEEVDALGEGWADTPAAFLDDAAATTDSPGDGKSKKTAKAKS